MLFFFVFFFQLIVMVFQTIGKSSKLKREGSKIFYFVNFLQGFPNGGNIGIIVAVEQFDGSVIGTLLGVFCLLIAIGFGVVSGGTLLMLTKVVY